MSTEIVKNVIDFNQAKKRSDRLKKNRRIAEMQDRFERAMGWEKKESPPPERPAKARKRQRR